MKGTRLMQVFHLILVVSLFSLLGRQLWFYLRLTYKAPRTYQEAQKILEALPGKDYKAVYADLYSYRPLVSSTGKTLFCKACKDFDSYSFGYPLGLAIPAYDSNMSARDHLLISCNSPEEKQMLVRRAYKPLRETRHFILWSHAR